MPHLRPQWLKPREVEWQMRHMSTGHAHCTAKRQARCAAGQPGLELRDEGQQRRNPRERGRAREGGAEPGEQAVLEEPRPAVEEADENWEVHLWRGSPGDGMGNRWRGVGSRGERSSSGQLFMGLLQEKHRSRQLQGSQVKFITLQELLRNRGQEPGAGDSSQAPRGRGSSGKLSSDELGAVKTGLNVPKISNHDALSKEP